MTKYSYIKTKPIIVTVSGKAGSGKDEFARFLKTRLDNKDKETFIIHQADYLKWICEKYLGVNKADKDDPLVRDTWQIVGTDLFRKDNPFYWVGTLEYNIRILDSYAHRDYIIIPDCRFRNEIDYFKDMGYTVYAVKVERPNGVSKLTADEQNHSSENSMNGYKFDYTIKSKTLTSLSYQVNKFAEEVLHD